MVTTVTICDGRVIGYLTADEFAKLNGINENTVRVWIKRKKIPQLYLLKIGDNWWINTSCPRIERRSYKTKMAKADKVFFVDVPKSLLIFVGIRWSLPEGHTPQQQTHTNTQIE